MNADIRRFNCGDRFMPHLLRSGILPRQGFLVNKEITAPSLRNLSGYFLSTLFEGATVHPALALYCEYTTLTGLLSNDIDDPIV